MSFRIFLFCTVAAIISVFLCGTILNSNIKAAVFSAKESELTLATSEYSASLSAYPEVFGDVLVVSQANRRLLLTDEKLSVIYDSSLDEEILGKTLLTSDTMLAFSGETVFSCKFLPSSVSSYVIKPVIKNDKTEGVLVLIEQDAELQYIFNTIGAFFLLFSILIFILFIVLAAVTSRFLIHRLSRLLAALKASQEKDSAAEKLPMIKNDEIAPIIDEFNTIYERLDYVQQMRQVFVSDASHELRTPLAAIKLLCESITQTDNIDAETTREFMSDILLEVDRMSHTAEKLLVLSRLDNGGKLKLAPIQISEIVKNAISNLSPIADDKDVTIEQYIEEDCIILGETEGVNQIVGNLIDNAIKYNNVGGTLRVYLFSKNDRIVFITDDTGIGIAPDEREHVFKRFYRVDKSRKHDGRGGSGLGLAIVKRNVESFGGSIRISDSVNGGTRFTVTFQNLVTEEGNNK